ncbi:MAG: hypothetical protein KAY37_02285 [Phycisphaerae bacterium]|nr:hypothetical protein [Phycisphaerae bacterium]
MVQLRYVHTRLTEDARIHHYTFEKRIMEITGRVAYRFSGEGREAVDTERASLNDK